MPAATTTATPVAPTAAPGTGTPTAEWKTPLEYLLAVMNDPEADETRRDRAAMAAAPLLHARAGDSGKKGQKAQAAEVAAKGRFSPAAPPKLVVNNH